MKDASMSPLSRRWIVGAVALFAGFLTLAPAPVAAAAADEQIATIQQLKSDAFKALRSGQFGKTNELLSQAATLSRDPADQQMASWTGSFETQRKEFAAERRKQYEKAVAEVKM